MVLSRHHPLLLPLSPFSTLGSSAIVPPRVTLQALGPFSWSLGQFAGGSLLLPAAALPLLLPSSLLQRSSLLQGAAFLK